MKTLIHSLITVAGLCLFNQQAQAASLTCAQIEAADQAGTIQEKPFHSDNMNEASLLAQLLRKAVVISESLTQAEAKAASFEELVEQFDPIFTNIAIGDREFHAVNLDLGDNPYVYLFTTDTHAYSSIHSADGSVMADDQYCQTGDDNF